MQPPYIPMDDWWSLAFSATLIWLLFFLPAMPSRRYRLQICLGPVLAAAYGVASHLVRGDGAELLLSMYVTAMLAIPLSLLGRRKWLAEAILHRDADGERRERGPSFGMVAQLVTSYCAVGGLMWWLGPGW